jgi:putative peptidoglycan lipid II flippase
MFLKAGALSLALLLASRLLGLARESAQAAAFGASGLADVVVLMLTLPDWLAGVLASGALAYVLVPAWAGQGAADVAATQRRLTRTLLAAGALLALLLIVLREPAVGLLAAGLPEGMRPAAALAIVWSAVAFPASLVAALWTTRLQHERDFKGMYSANLVVNAILIGAIAGSAFAPAGSVLHGLGGGLLAAMLARLAWLRWRIPADAAGTARAGPLPAPNVWLWAALSAGLPLALPFVARSVASQSGEGALATFNYAWKLVELPLILAVQLVATLAFPMIARATATGDARVASAAIRNAFALAWALACAAAAALLLGAPAIARLLFGWGRMDAAALELVSRWGSLGAWSLLPQAVIAVAVTVLATQGRMKLAVGGYALALLGLLFAAASGWADGARLMVMLDFLFAGVALALVAGLGKQARAWMPWRSMAIAAGALLLLAAISGPLSLGSLGVWAGLAAAAAAGLGVMLVTWCGSADLRAALAR